jgi:hypothetical protein
MFAIYDFGWRCSPTTFVTVKFRTGVARPSRPGFQVRRTPYKGFRVRKRIIQGVGHGERRKLTKSPRTLPCNGHDEAPHDDVHVCRCSGTQRKTGATVTPRPRSRLGLARSQYVTVTLLPEGTGPNPTVRQHVRWISVIIHLFRGHWGRAPPLPQRQHTAGHRRTA